MAKNHLWMSNSPSVHFNLTETFDGSENDSIQNEIPNHMNDFTCFTWKININNTIAFVYPIAEKSMFGFRNFKCIELKWNA